MQSIETTVRSGEALLGGTLTLPDDAVGMVLFAHGSSSSRFSPRNRFVAGFLNEGGLGTLLFDLLTPGESEIDGRTAALRFDIGLLGRRLTGAVDWLAQQRACRTLPVGLFGASTGAAAALVAAAARPGRVAAVVSRGGRPDLAMEAIAQLRAPTLLIVGGLDGPVIEMNRRAATAMGNEHRVEIVPGATHLFEEPGTLEAVARLARDWFQRHLRAAAEGTGTPLKARSRENRRKKAAHGNPQEGVRMVSGRPTASESKASTRRTRRRLEVIRDSG